jgi:hypothetical protein
MFIKKSKRNSTISLDEISKQYDKKRRTRRWKPKISWVDPSDKPNSSKILF